MDQDSHSGGITVSLVVGTTEPSGCPWLDLLSSPQSAFSGFVLIVISWWKMLLIFSGVLCTSKSAILSILTWK